jgi:transcriptional regulator with XRE-family HTH domain
MESLIGLGKKVKNLRLEKRMSIAILSAETTLSQGLISLIERDKTNPTVTTLWKIAKALDVNIGYFFSEEENSIMNPVIRKNNHRKLLIGNEETIYELLTIDPHRKIDVQKITLKSKTSSSADLISHEGEECIYVVKGTFKVKTANGTYMLSEGDSIEYKSTVPHLFTNESDDECILICAMLSNTW